MASVADILNDLNDFGFADTSTTSKLARINDSIRDICKRKAWPFLETSTTLTFDGTNAKPSNLPALFRASRAVVDPTNGRTIHWVRLDALEKQNALLITQTGDPLVYYFEGRNLQVAPIPPSSQTLRLRYYQFHPLVDATTLESGILIPPDGHWAITLGTLIKLYAQDDDPQMSQWARGEFEAEVANLIDDQFGLQYDRPEHIYVPDDDDHFYYDGPF